MRAFYFWYFANIGVVVPYFTLYFESLGLGPLQIGVLTSIMPLGRPLFATLWTVPADRRGLRHAALVLAAWLATAAYALYLVPTTFAGLALVTVIAAIAHAPTHALGEAAVLDATRRSGEAYGRIRVWGSIGFIAAALGFGAALERAPIRSVLWAAVAFLGLMAISAARLPRPAPEAPRRRTSLRGFLRRPGVLPFYAASMLMQASHGAYYTFYTIHMAAQGHAPAEIGALWSLGVLAEVVIMWVSPRLLAMAPPSGMLTACFVLAAARWGLYAASTSLWIALPAQVLHAFTFGVFHLSAVTATHRIFPDDLRASGQAVYSGLTFGIGTVVGGMTAGALYGVIGGFRLFAVCALIALAGAFLIGRATRRIPGFDAPVADVA